MFRYLIFILFYAHIRCLVYIIYQTSLSNKISIFLFKTNLTQVLLIRKSQTYLLMTNCFKHIPLHVNSFRLNFLWIFLLQNKQNFLFSVPRVPKIHETNPTKNRAMTAITTTSDTSTSGPLLSTSKNNKKKSKSPQPPQSCTTTALMIPHPNCCHGVCGCVCLFVWPPLLFSLRNLCAWSGPQRNQQTPPTQKKSCSANLPAGEERGLPGQVRLGCRLGCPQSGLEAATKDAAGGGRSCAG